MTSSSRYYNAISKCHILLIKCHILLTKLKTQQLHDLILQVLSSFSLIAKKRIVLLSNKCQAIIIFTIIVKKRIVLLSNKSTIFFRNNCQEKNSVTLKQMASFSFAIIAKKKIVLFYFETK